MKDDLITKPGRSVRNEQMHASGMSFVTAGANLMIVVASFRYSYYLLLTTLPLMLIVWYVAKYITKPRIGLDQMLPRYQTKASLWFFSASTCIIVALGVATVVKMSDISAFSIHVFGGVLITVVLLIILAWSLLFLPKSNMVIILDYGILMLGFGGMQFLKLPDDASYLLIMIWGTANVILGLWRLVTFIRTYPVMLDIQGKAQP